MTQPIIYTKAPTNPCCSALNNFYSDKNASLTGPWAFAKTNTVYESPIKKHDLHVQNYFKDGTVGAGHQNNYLSCPSYNYKGNVMQPMPRGNGIKDACYNPPPQIQWYKYGMSLWTKRSK